MIQIGNHSYDVTQMPPRLQQHVLRRLAPLVSTMGPTIMALLDEEADKKAVMAQVAFAVGPISEALAAMSDSNLDYILDACLLHVRRLDSDQAWHPIYVPGNGGKGVIRMYADVDSGTELRLVAEVIKVNLAGFFGPLFADSASANSAEGQPAQQS